MSNPYRIAADREPIDIYIEPMPVRRRVLTQLRVLALVAASLPFVEALPACLTDQMHKDVAQDVYAAQQAACIDQYADKPSIDKCRDRVKKAWLATDAGTRTLAFGNDNGHPDAGVTDAEAAIVDAMQASAKRSEQLLEAGIAQLEAGK